MATQRFKVSILSDDDPENRYFVIRRAHNPLEALLKAGEYMGLADLNEPRFVLEVQPISNSRRE